MKYNYWRINHDGMYQITSHLNVLAQKTRIEIMADAMSRDRYFLLRNNLKVVNESSVPQQSRTSDRLWKLRLLLDKIK